MTTTTTTTTAPFVDADAVATTVDAVCAEPALGEVTFRMTSRPGGGLVATSQTGALTQGETTDESRAGKFALSSDEPEPLLGSDTAVSPAEYALKALAGCYTVTLASLAAARGIQVDAMEMSLEFEIDLRGFLGIDHDIRKGARQIRVDLDLQSETATREDLQALVEAVESTSPLRDTLANPVDVVTRLR